MEWKSLEDEHYRIYTFMENGQPLDVWIHSPIKLNVSASGGHRILDAAGNSHYIPFKWIHLVWKVKAGEEPFAF